MDPILTTLDVLNHENWIYFKIYKDPSSPTDWKTNLNWYHQVLIDVVKHLIHNNNKIRAVFFGIYGPTTYELSRREEYEKRIEPPSSNVVYIRLRLSLNQDRKEDVKNSFIEAFQSNRNIVWDYETIVTFHVRHGIGRRYGSNNDVQTLQFIRYWDSACRYILSILNLPENWFEDVDVWGIPHLVNNSLGGFLRPRNRPCPKCDSPLYMVTLFAEFSLPFQTKCCPNFIFVCPNCGFKDFQCINI